MFTEALRKFWPNMGWSEVESLTRDLVAEEHHVPEGEFLTTKSA